MKLPRQKPTRGKNLIGPQLRRLRLELEPKVTLEDLSGRLAARGLYLDRTALSRIENQQRAVFDFEVPVLASALKVPLEKLYRSTT